MEWWVLKCMKSVVHTNRFHSNKCGLNYDPPSCCLNRGDHVTVSLCPLLSSVLCRFTFHHLRPSSSSPTVTPHMGVLAASQREGDVSKVIRVDYFPIWRTHRRPNSCCITSNLLAVRVFLWITGELEACQKSVAFISAEPQCFSSQAASKQSIYKRFWLLFFTQFLCQEGNMIDRWLELLCCCEPTKSTCPSRTIPSYSLVGFFLVFNECFCANRTRWLRCIVRCWSSSRSLVLLQFSKGKLPIVWSVDPSYRGVVVIGVQRKNRICSQFAMLKRTSKQELEKGISCGSNDTSVTDGLWRAAKKLMCCRDFYCFPCSGLWY